MPGKIPAKQILLHIEGIRLGPGALFTSPVMAALAYGLLFGHNYEQAAANQNIRKVLRTRATSILTQLFTICVARAATFAALDDSNLGWQVVAGDIAEQYGCALQARDVSELVAVFGTARILFLEHTLPGIAQEAQPSELTTLIDRWIDAMGHDDQVAAGAQPSHAPLTTSLLPSRPAPMENLAASFSLHTLAPSPSPAANAITAQSWPPSHLPAADRDLLNHYKVRERLAGVCWSAKGAMPAFPGDNSDPLALRLFLGCLAAAHTPVSPVPRFALFAAPIAFMNNKERQAWFRPSGNQSKMFGHMDGSWRPRPRHSERARRWCWGCARPCLPPCRRPRDSLIPPATNVGRRQPPTSSTTARSCAVSGPPS